MVIKRPFYGWWIVVVSIIGISVNHAPFAIGSLSFFVEPMSSEFGWNRAQISIAPSILMLTLAFSITVLGRIMDNVGVRRILIPSLFIFAILLIAIPVFVSQLWHFYLIYFFMGSIGGGVTSSGYLWTIVRWFDRNRGLAIGIAMSGAGLGFFYVPLILQYVIAEMGWRAGYYSLASIIIFIVIPLVWMSLVESPHRVGLTVDGKPSQADQDLEVELTGIPPLSAIHKPAFWIMGTIFCLLAFSLYGLLPHLVPMLTDRGVTSVRAAAIMSTIGITVGLSRAIIGFLLDKYFAPFVAATCFSAALLGVFILAMDFSGYMLFIAALLVGIAVGAEFELLAYLTTRYFGLKYFGLMYGLFFAIFLIGGAFGPWCYGLVFESTGAYTVVLYCSAFMIFVSCLLALILPKYPDGFAVG
jgi:MFS family permease